MKKKSLVLALAVLAFVGCDAKKDDTKEVQELKQEIEDLKANVKELEEDKSKDKEEDKSKDNQETEIVDEEAVLEERPEEVESPEYSDLEEIKDDLEKKKPSNLSDIIMINIEAMTSDAVSAVEFEESINLIKNNPEIFLDDNAADSLINMFNHVYWDELYLDASTPQPITLVEGRFIAEYNASLGSDKFNVFKVGFSPNPKRDDVPFFTVFYCGNVRNYLYPYNNGQKYLKIWALPVGAYQLKNKDGETYTTYIFVSSETFQHTDLDTLKVENTK